MAGAIKIINIANRSLAFFWALLIMALMGNAIAEQFSGSSVINYALFCSVFAMLSLFYLIPATFSEGLQFHPAIPIALDALNAIFWFTCAVALAAELGVHSCSDNSYTASNRVTSGTGNREKRCREAQASDAFLWFGFASFVVSAVLTGLQSRGSVSTRPGGVRKGPSMSKV